MICLVLHSQYMKRLCFRLRLHLSLKKKTRVYEGRYNRSSDKKHIGKTKNVYLL